LLNFRKTVFYDYESSNYCAVNLTAGGMPQDVQLVRSKVIQIMERPLMLQWSRIFVLVWNATSWTMKIILMTSISVVGIMVLRQWCRWIAFILFVRYFSSQNACWSCCVSRKVGLHVSCTWRPFQQGKRKVDSYLVRNL
jgi:hypothetical protein